MKLALVLAVLTIAAGCSFRQEKHPAQPATDPALSARAGEIPSYAEIRDQVLVPRCLQCHTQQAPQLTSYEGVRSALEAVRTAAIAERKMPPSGPLPAEEAGLLKTWIDAGAPELGSGPAPQASPSPASPVDAPVTWARLRGEVLDRSCISCHYAGNTQNLSDLSDPAVVSDNIGTTFYITVVTGEMPPAGSPPLTRGQKRLFADWVADGMQR